MSQIARLSFVLASVIFGLAQGNTITRPCATDDVDCIRQWFAARANCNPDVNEAKVDPLYIKSFILPVPFFNATEEKTDVILTGMNDTIVIDFYEDKEADLAVLTMQHSFVMDGWVHISFHKTNERDFLISSQFQDIFTNFITTTKFSGLDGFSIDNGEVFFEAPIMPQIIFGRGLYDGLTNERSAPTLIAVTENLPIITAEESLPIAKVTALGYVKNKFCTPKGFFPAYVGIDL